MIRLEVAVAVPLQGTLTYLYNQKDDKNKDTEGWDCIGKRALVPLGRRVVTGYILGHETDQSTALRLKYIDEILDEEPLFHPDIIPFFRWVAEYYHYPIGEVIRAALPPGLHRSSRKIITLFTTNADFLQNWPYSDIEEPRWFEKLIRKKSLSVTDTKRILENDQEKKVCARLSKDRFIELSYEVEKAATQERFEVCYTSELALQPPINLEEVSRESLQPFHQQIVDKTSRDLRFSETKTLYYHALLARNLEAPVPQQEILQLYKGAGKALVTLTRNGLVTKISRRVYRNPLGQVLSTSTPPVNLTSEQKNVIDTISLSLQDALYRTFLLHGITGCGKTEVYLRAAEVCLKMGKDVLVLVPEIALATQLESHFFSRFGEMIVLLHSGLSKGQKFDQWSLAAKGKAKIVIGARSAVFAPLKNIGLIVVDEEHDGGFKQDDNLKYNGRDLAVLRGNFINATVILGSATPSVTSYFHAKSGKYTLLSMKKRVGKSVLPTVELIDLKRTDLAAQKSIFHQKFITQIENNLQQKEQSLILLNRRGFSSSYLCQDCGASVQCTQCNVALTYHRERSRLICHYCGYQVTSRIICSTCNSEKLVPFGFGTERIESEFKEMFPEARICRLDSDAAADRNTYIGILKAMQAQEIDILIGTQMIAKGHHFPNVTFVGVVWADAGLNMPDFRAAEKTYQLLSQVTGRAGRGDKHGRVIIQTMRPKHYAIELAKNHMYEQFYEREIKLRRKPVFPPFVRLICFRIHGEIEYNVRKTAENISDACKFFGRTKECTFEILGPAMSPLEKLKNRYRWQLLVKGNDIGCLHALSNYILSNIKDLNNGKVDVSLDIDPENMM